MRGTGWTSPWGTYEEFLKLAIEFSGLNNNNISFDDAMSARRGPFAMPIMNNLLDGGAEEYIEACRKRIPIHYTYKDQFKKKSVLRFENYKRRILGNYSGQVND